jgi:DNA replication protein DnaC
MMDLHQALRTIGLHHTAQTLDDLIAHATKRHFGPRELIEHIAKNEEVDRKNKSLERRSRRSRVGKFKPMADFDWNWPKKIDRDAVEQTLTLDFINQAANVVLVGPAGLGKTMIAQNLVHQAVLKGHQALFISAAELLNDLVAQDSARALERKLKFYCQSQSLLCIDEIGFLTYQSRAADLLYQVISRRHQKKSLIVTTNLAFSDWPSVFPNASCTVAMVDRLVEYSSIIDITGDSWRKRNAEQKLKANSKKAKAAA